MNAGFVIEMEIQSQVLGSSSMTGHFSRAGWLGADTLCVKNCPLISQRVARGIRPKINYYVYNLESKQKMTLCS